MAKNGSKAKNNDPLTTYNYPLTELFPSLDSEKLQVNSYLTTSIWIICEPLTI